MTTEEKELLALDRLGLTRVTAALYVALAERPNYPHLRSYLIERVWRNRDTPHDTDNRLASAVRNLRKLLPEDQAVETIYGMGFKLVVPDDYVSPWAEKMVARADESSGLAEPSI
jgi:DNA-binding response OmpR family regulator